MCRPPRAYTRRYGTGVDWMSLSPEEVEARRRQLEEMRRQKAAERRKHALMTAVVFLSGLVLASVVGYMTFQRGASTLGLSFRLPFIQQAPKDELVTILFLGIDNEGGAPSRADAIMLIGFRPQQGEVGVVSVPRDTRVRVPGRGYDRLNAAQAYGGPQLVRQTLEEFLGMRIDYFIQADFAGFERLIDALGGVEMVVDYRMKYDDYAAGLHIDLAPGKQRLDGRSALHYVRYRGGLGDVALVDPVHERYDGRVVRQLRFVQALSKEILRPEALLQLPVLVAELRRLIVTDMPLDRMLELTAALHRVDSQSVATGLVPGVGQVIGGASYWVADPNQARKVVNDILLGQRDS